MLSTDDDTDRVPLDRMVDWNWVKAKLVDPDPDLISKVTEYPE